MYKSYSELGAQPEQNVDQYNIVEIQNGQHKQESISQNRVVCIDTYADWCGPCRRIAPDFATMAAKYNRPGECLLIKENYEKNLSQGISGIPTFQFFLQGRKVDEVVGADMNQVEAKLLQILQAPQAPQVQQRPPPPPQRGVQGPPVAGTLSRGPATEQTGPQYRKSSIRQHGSVYHGQNVDGQDYKADQGNGPIYGYPTN